jgi:hypothetical protein
MLIALPQKDIALVQGVLQTIGVMLSHIGLGALMPLVAAMLALASAGAACAWLAGSSRIPFVAAQDGYLPRSLARLHPRYASPHVALLTFGGLCALALAISFAGATLNEAYLTVLDLSIILSLLQYIYMYAALISLLLCHRHMKTIFSRTTLALTAGSGMVTTLLGTAFAFVPTRRVEHVWLFELKLLGSCLLMLGVGATFFYVNSRAAKGSPSMQKWLFLRAWVVGAVLCIAAGPGARAQEADYGGERNQEGHRYKVLYDFHGGLDPLEVLGLAADVNGNVYGSSLFGGFGAGTEFKLDRHGALTLFPRANFVGTAVGATPGPLVLDAEDSLIFAADRSLKDTGGVFRLNPHTGGLTALLNFSGAPVAWRPCRHECDSRLSGQLVWHHPGWRGESQSLLLDSVLRPGLRNGL